MGENNETTPLNTSDGHSDNEQPSRGKFHSRIGMVLSCMGCMVGTGNLWRFPRVLANNSGETGALQFLLVWVLFLFLWSIPILFIEYAVGRYCKLSVIRSYKFLIGSKNMWCGGWIITTATLISAYYAVLVGWCFYYAVYFMIYPLPENLTESEAIFYNFTAESYWPLVCNALIVTLGALSILTSVRGIEIVNSILVPTLLVLLLFTFIWAMTLDNAVYGLKFMFSPTWDLLLSPKTWVDAASQSAFDTGAGNGLFISYSAFMTADNGIVRIGTLVPISNNIISLLNGMTIFATVFGIEISQGKNLTEILTLLQTNGPGNTGLTFIWMPLLYSTATIGRVLAIAFFLAILFAGLSSVVAQMEFAVKTTEDLGVRRKVAVLICSAVVFLIGLPSALNLSFLASQDFVWGFALIVSGLFLQYLVIRYDSSDFRARLINEYSSSDWYLPKLWEWIIKFVAPVEAAILLLWFMLDNIINDADWYTLGFDTLMMCLLQWGVVIFGVILANVIYVMRCLPKNEHYPVTMDTNHYEVNGIEMPKANDVIPDQSTTFP
ncbi:putative sodium-dependent transporter YocR [Saccoglossus kowalevskii]|uniref:Sodium- and chloride-dependent GABA transporter ine-like n=1 Tax=Saccoglossus kowalevskii TaxID=10224 RepID=A0ABM0MEB1_SACKO|nr:PREDICTED: sodium- and chloride-dependent GABA transporter ine-like [Saccoglossus kowalevskii]